MTEPIENDSPGEYWGNRPSAIDTEQICRMLFQNTNGFDENTNDTKTNDGFQNSKDLQVSILVIAEHHLNMRHQQVATNFTSAIKKKSSDRPPHTSQAIQPMQTSTQESRMGVHR